MSEELHELSRVVVRLREITHQEKVPIVDLLQALEEAGPGPMLLIPAALIVLPTGMIPGVPDIMAILMLFAMLRLLRIGRWRRPTGWIARRTLSGARLERALIRAEWAALKLDPYVKRRWAWMVESWPARVLIAVIILISTLVIFIIGLIPGLPALVSIPLIVLAIALTAEDGRVLLLAFVSYAPVVAGIVWLLG